MPMKTIEGYSKEKYTDASVLLAGGGAKALSEFSMSHSHPYLPLTGGTLTGSLTFANGTWNIVGDDAAIGDYNVAGSLGLKSINNNIPSIGFHNSSNTLLGTLKCDAGILKWNTNTIWHVGNDGSGSGLDADKLDGYHASNFAISSHNHDTVYLSRLRMRNPSDGTSAQGGIPFPISLKGAGYPVYSDPEFASGTNDVYVYNNYGNGVVTLSRIADNQGSSNSSGYILQISTSNGEATPGRGGFYQTIQSRKNAVFAQIFRAKIPIGFSVVNAENYMGDGYTTYWLTDTAGTGKWEWYIRITICGTGGTFSSGGHVYLSGSGAVTWYLSYCNLIDLTKGNYDGLRTRYADYSVSASNASNARYVIADNNAASPGYALLQSGSGRADASPSGDTWLYWDALGGTTSPWGFMHQQYDNLISFYGAGKRISYIDLANGFITAETYNSWLSPARTQLGRKDTTAYTDRSCIGSTDGNLHLDSYKNKDIYLNYYCLGENNSQGRIYFNGSSYYIKGGYYNGTAAYATSAGSAGSATYLTPQSYTAVNNTVGGHKAGLVNWLNNDSSVGIGKHVIVGASIINQWDNDSATYYDSSVYAMIKIGGGYNYSTYGQWLLSSYNTTRVGIVGRNYNNWSSIKWIAWTSDIPTKVSQLTNDSGYLTSLPSHNHDGRYLRKDTNDSTSYQYSFTKTNDHAIQVGTIRGRAVGSQTGEYIHLYERVAIGSPSGWGSRNAPTYGLATYGGAWLATDTGNVGIGTTSPSEKLEVSGNIRVLNPSDSQIIARFLNYSSAPYGLMIKSYLNGSLHLQSQRESNNSEVFPLLLNPNGGNIGIGTTSPVTKLDVRGTDGVSMSMDTSNAYRFSTGFKGTLYLGHASHGSGSGVNDGYTDGITFGVNGAAYAGIIVQNSGSYGSRILFTTTDDYSYNKARMILDAQGKLGILTMSPLYTLDVRGNIRATENLIVSTNNTTGGGIIFADDGDIVDLNDAFCTMRFTSGIRITNANRGGNVVHELNVNGKLYNYGLYHYSYGSYDYLLTSNGSARHITSLPYLPYSGWWNSGSGQNVDDANGMTFVYGDHGSPNGWGILCTFDYTYNSGYKFQLFAEGYSAAGMYYRCRSSDRGGWTNWKTVIDSGNIGSQSVNYANSSGYASSAGSISSLTASDEASSTNTWRRIWISYNDNATGRPAWTDNLVFLVSTGTLKTNRVEATTGFFQTSDFRKKNILGNINEYKAYDFVKNCKPIIYELKDDETHDKQLGLIAQEVEEYFPELVITDENGFKSMDYSRLSVVLFALLKDLIKRNKL